MGPMRGNSNVSRFTVLRPVRTDVTEYTPGVMKTKRCSQVTALTAIDHNQYQLGFLGTGGHTGTAGRKPFRFGISIFGKLFASRASLS
jgi:hypothetical protein